MTRWPGVHGWGGSLILHGLALTAILLLVQPDTVPSTPMRWEVSMISPTPPPAKTNPPPPPALNTESLRETRRSPPPAQKAADTIPSQQVRSPVVEPAFEPVRQPDPIQSVMPVPPAPAPAVAAMPAPILAAAPTPAVLPAEAPVVAPRPDPEAQRRWQSLLAEKLMELKRYPMLARRQGQEGVVVLQVRFQSNGRAEAGIKRSSGHAALDLAAIKLFEDAMEALAGKPIPSGLGGLDIPVAYRLES